MFQQHLGLTLGIEVNFLEHMKNITGKISNTMSILLRFQATLPRSYLITICKKFIKVRLCYRHF